MKASYRAEKDPGFGGLAGGGPADVILQVFTVVAEHEGHLNPKTNRKKEYLPKRVSQQGGNTEGSTETTTLDCLSNICVAYRDANIADIVGDEA
ncbi:hypothetical protein V3C99_003693 [Haemonchus contortus]